MYTYRLSFLGVKIKREGGTFAGALALFLAIFLTFYAAFTGIVMLIVGAVHHSLWHSIPAYSYWQSLLLTVVLGFLSSIFNRG